MSRMFAANMCLCKLYPNWLELFANPRLKIYVHKATLLHEMTKIKCFGGTDTGPSFVSKTSFHHSCLSCKKLQNLVELSSASKQQYRSKSGILVRLWLSSLRIRARFGTVQNLASDLLVGIFLIHECIRKILSKAYTVNVALTICQLCFASHQGREYYCFYSPKYKKDRSLVLTVNDKYIRVVIGKAVTLVFCLH